MICLKSRWPLIKKRKKKRKFVVLKNACLQFYFIGTCFVYSRKELEMNGKICEVPLSTVFKVFELSP